MAVEDDDDRATYLETDEHGTAATYRRTGQSQSSTVNGIFGNGFREVQGIETSTPMFLCRSSDVPYVQHGDEFDIGGVTYKFIGVDPDGAGMVSIFLEKKP